MGFRRHQLGGKATKKAADSAKAALAMALPIQLRLFAPFLPFVTEEVWSWWRTGSVHRALWPSPDEIARVAGDGDAALLDTVGAALSQVRRAKSERKLSMRAEIKSDGGRPVQNGRGLRGPASSQREITDEKPVRDKN